MKVAGAALRGILRKITAVSLTFAQCSVEKFSVVHSVLGELCSCVFAQCSTWCNIVKKSAHSARWAVQLCRVECCSAGSQLSAAGGVVVYLHRKDRWCAGWSDDDDELSWIMNYHLSMHCSDCTEVLNLTVEHLHCSWMVQSSVNCWCCWSSSNGRWGIEDDDDKGSSSPHSCTVHSTNTLVLSQLVLFIFVEWAEAPVCMIHQPNPCPPVNLIIGMKRLQRDDDDDD